MTQHLAFCCDGARNELQVPSSALLGQVARQLPPASTVVAGRPRQAAGAPHVHYAIRPDANGAGAYRLYRGARLLESGLRRAEAVRLLQSDLHEAVARHGNRLYVHAGVVGWRGRAIVIPGVSHAGKSSLVAAMVRLGALYYSDEYAVFEADGTVSSYLKPVSLRRAAGLTRMVPAAKLGGRCGRKPLPLGLVLAARYRPGAEWRPVELTQAECMMTLLGNTVMARSRPEQTMATLSRAASTVGATGLRGFRGEAGPMAQALLTELQAKW